ncbi:MAG TPA: two-component regulator propeller domain-containing protein, partial [Candidatus Dormibacteraeota bacterium]|nr:two-component regulator propeller domain-containing protein [Candidatus Dormibacteraeota bacterium]
MSASPASPSSSFIVDAWRFDDDLPRDGINSLAQGDDGYLWVSSRYGLARFDGARFADFSSRSGAQFGGHHFANLLTGVDGTVWLATPGGGLLKWHGQRLTSCLPAGNPVFGPGFAGLTNAAGRELVLTPDGRLLAFSNGAPQLLVKADRWGEPVYQSVCQERSGAVCFVTYEHKLVRAEGTNAQELVWGSGEERRNWIALAMSATGELWAGTQRDLGVWRANDFHPLEPPTDPFPVDDVIAVPKGRSVAANAQSRLWVIALGRAWLLEGQRWVTNVPFESLAGLYETSPRMADREGNLWFTGTKTGIIRAGPDGSLERLSEEDGILPGRLAALYEDREGSIWAGIEHAGLLRLRPRYFTTLGIRQGTKGPLVWAVAEDPAGAVWLGTEHGGLHRWQQGKFSQFNLGNDGLPGSVYSLCLDANGSLWAGTGDRGVFRFDNGKFSPVWEYPDPGWNKRVYSLYQDHSRRVWFGTGLGLFCWSDGTVREYKGKDFEMGVVRVMAEDSDGRLWAGLSGGGAPRLAWLDQENFTAEGIREGLTGHDVFALRTEPGSVVWIGTVGDGLWRRSDGKLARIGTR